MRNHLKLQEMKINENAELTINKIVDAITNIGTWIIVASVILMLTLFSMLGFFDGFSDDDTDMAVWCKEYHPDLEYEQCVEKAGV